jgi:creatinine amidohydrolase
VLRWVHHAGFRRVLILNGHVTNWAPLRCALEYVRAELDDCLVALRDVGGCRRASRRSSPPTPTTGTPTAARPSLMLAVAPDRVRVDAMRDADDPGSHHRACCSPTRINRTSTNGVTGMPSRATRAARRNG